MSDYVSNDLMADIFKRLQLKSIIQLRSLSKYWHSRLASPEFMRVYRLQCSENPQKVLIKHLTYCGNYAFKDIYTLHPVNQLPLDPGPGYEGIQGVEFEPHYQCGTTEVVGSCNGILCLLNKEISLWNFSIRRKLIVPCHPCLISSARVALGFGFDSITDDYKILAISYSEYENENNTFIYSLRTDSWSAIFSPSTRICDVKSKACFFNGTLHWVVDGYLTEPSMEEAKGTQRFILTFSLNSLVFGHIWLPTRWEIRQLTTINGCLAMVYSQGGGNWRIRALKKYDCNVESWSRLLDYRTGRDDLIRVVQPVVNGDLVVYCDGSKVYKNRPRLLTNLLTFGPCFNFEMETYVESLELLDKERAIACGETIRFWAKKIAYKRIPLS